MQTANCDRASSTYPASWKSLRGRRGRLAQLPDMPLDILLEVHTEYLFLTMKIQTNNLAPDIWTPRPAGPIIPQPLVQADALIPHDPEYELGVETSPIQRRGVARLSA